MEEQEILRLCAFRFVNLCVETEAETLTYTLNNATRGGEPIGTWEIIVKKVEDKN